MSIRVAPIRIVFAAMVFCGASFSVGAHAAGADPAAAEALFAEGREAARRGDAEVACARFAESQRLDPAAGTLLNLADCEEKLGKIASAWAHLREALDALSPSDDRVPAATKRAGELEPRLPRLAIKLADGVPPEARVERDGADVGKGSLGVPIPVDPGTHRVVVRAPGRRARSYEITMTEARRSELVADVGDPAIDPPHAVDVSTAAPAPNRALGWVLLGSGGVLAAAGAVTGLLAIDRNRFMNDHCNAARECDGEGLDAGRSGRTFDVVSTVSFIAAGVLVTGGIAWLLTHPSPRVGSMTDARTQASSKSAKASAEAGAR